MATVEKIRFLTANYSRLQGLKAIPSGLLLFLVVLWVNRQAGETRDLTLPLLWLGAGVVLYGLTDRYYRRTYGRVEQARKEYWTDMLYSMLVSIAAIAAFVVDMGAVFPISLFALVFAAGLFLDYVRMLRMAGVKNVVLFPIGLLCIAGMALSALLPLLSGPDSTLLGFQSPILFVYAVDGIITMLYGVAGHLYLARSMVSNKEVPHEQSV